MFAVIHDLAVSGGSDKVTSGAAVSACRHWELGICPFSPAHSVLAALCVAPAGEPLWECERVFLWMAEPPAASNVLGQDPPASLHPC